MNVGGRQNLDVSLNIFFSYSWTLYFVYQKKKTLYFVLFFFLLFECVGIVYWMFLGEWVLNMIHNWYCNMALNSTVVFTAIRLLFRILMVYRFIIWLFALRIDYLVYTLYHYCYWAIKDLSIVGILVLKYFLLYSAKKL